MKFLVLNYMIYQYTGSEINALQICEELISQGHEADIGALVIGSPMAEEVKRRGVRLIDLNQVTEPLNYDVIWAHHSPVLAHVLFNTDISDCRILFSSLSWLAPLEAPPTFHQDIHLFLSISKTNTNAMIENGVAASKVVYFPNYVPKSFYQPVENGEAQLKRIAIVSNHVPKELLEFSDLAIQKGLQVEIIGLEAQPKFVSREILNEFDLVISIGKTVYYCFAMGKPVYVYDHFGGPGYVNSFDVKNNKINLAGLGGPQKSAEELYFDIIKNFDNNLEEVHFLQDLCYEHFDLEKNLSGVLKKLSEIPITEINELRKNHSLDKRIYAILDYIKYTVSFDLDKTKTRLSNTEQVITRLKKELSTEKTKMKSVKQELENVDDELVALYSSLSWKITRPLRGFRKFLRRIII